MASQEMETLFIRYKGEVVTVKTISGGIYEGRVTEITSDYVCLTETGIAGAHVFLCFLAVESLTTNES